jgi:hypothetical protein
VLRLPGARGERGGNGTPSRFRRNAGSFLPTWARSSLVYFDHSICIVSYLLGGERFPSGWPSESSRLGNELPLEHPLLVLVFLFDLELERLRRIREWPGNKSCMRPNPDRDRHLVDAQSGGHHLGPATPSLRGPKTREETTSSI